jgi:hypothetical protein
MGLKSIDGLPIVDARKGIEIEVTDRDCQLGDPLVPKTCAAARAIRRSGALDVRVHLGRVYIRSNKGNWQRYVPSGRLHVELVVFDRGGKMQAGKYKLHVPAKIKRGGKVKPQGPRSRKPKITQIQGVRHHATSE